MKIKIRLSCLLLFGLLSSQAFAQFKVIGYVHPRRNQATDLGRIGFQYLTHINIAFVNPDSTGNLILPAGFDSLVQAAHSYKVKALASLGGGSHNPYLAGLLRDTGRGVLVQRLVQLVQDHQLDGLDIDIENDNIDSNYTKLVTELAAALKPAGKLLTAALATWNGSIIPDAALSKYDFINVMSYDQTGPWNPEKPGPHSTYQKAEEDLHYWIASRGLSREKLNLGVPFYGYGFGTKYGQSMSYATILNTFPGADTLDMLLPDSGGVIHYNGLLTIKNKALLAKKNAGGIMIWELQQDAEGDKSLLMAIDKIVKAEKGN